MTNQTTISADNAIIFSGFNSLSNSDKKIFESIRIQDIIDSDNKIGRNSFTPLINNPKQRIVIVRIYGSGFMIGLREKNYGNWVPDWGLDSASIAYLPR